MAGKRKRMTQREKQKRARAKKALQEKGIIRPDKPKLNRKKFIDGALKDWEDREASYRDLIFLIRAAGYVLGRTERDYSISKEAVGAAKVFKIAVRLADFQDKLLEEGKTEYTVAEELEFIRDILET